MQYVSQIVLREPMHLGKETRTIERALQQSLAVGQHTGIVWFRPRTPPKRYIWSEPRVRPFGLFLPFQCSMCGGIWSWERKKNGATPLHISFQCTFMNKKGVQCKNVFVAHKDPKLTTVDRGYPGVWMTRDDDDEEEEDEED